MNNNYTVYIHKFPNGKHYIGLTKMSTDRRWGKNGEGYKTQYVYKAIQKYGWDNIKHIIYKDKLTAEEAMKLEQELIEQYNSIIDGYNINPGGELGYGCPNVYNYKGKGYTIYQLLEDKNINVYSITYRCARYRLESGWSPEDTFETPQFEKYNFFEYNGNKYTIYELAELNGTGITPLGIFSRIRRGGSIEDVVTIPFNEKTMLREYDGKLYTLDELANKFADKSVNGKDIGARLRRGWDIERALRQPKGTKKQPFGIVEPTYKYNGELYNSYQLSQIYPELGLSSANITNRINEHHWDIEKAISTPKKQKDIIFEYNGKKYNSYELLSICKDKTMNHNNITDRYRAGWTIDEIVNIPKGTTRKQYYNH